MMGFGFFVGLMEVVTLLTMSGGPATVLPVALPPRPFDAQLAALAPEDAIYYYQQMGRATEATEPRSDPERLLADPAMRAYLSRMMQLGRTRLLKLVATGEGDEENAEQVGKLIDFLNEAIQSPLMVFVNIDLSIEDFGPGGGDLLTSYALMIRMTPERAAAGHELIKTLLESEGVPLAAQPFEGGVTSDRVALPGGVVDLAHVDDLFIVAGGEETLKEILERHRQGAQLPSWLSRARADGDIERPNSILVFRSAPVLKVFQEVGVGGVFAGWGIANLETIESVSGIDGEDFAVHRRLRFGGPIQGLMASVSDRPLEASDLAVIPSDALAALALRTQPKELVDDFVQAVVVGFPFGVPQDPFEMMKDEIGFHLRDDLMAALLGDLQLVVFAPGDDRRLPDAQITVGVRDAKKLEKVVKILESFIEENLPPDADAEFTMVRHKHGDVQIVGIEQKDVMADEETDSPRLLWSCYWALTSDRFIMATSVERMKAFLDKPLPDQPITTRPEIGKAMKKKPFVLLHVDTPRALRKSKEPMKKLLLLAKDALGPESGDALDSLPWESWAEKTQPTTMAFYRTEQAIVAETRESLPAIGAAALTLSLSSTLVPTVEQARRARQRAAASNNARMLMLAFHNYHEVHRAFPPAYSVDKEGKPLLSWRVHLLPYLDEGELYDEFHLDEPWDSEHNKKLIDKMPEVFASQHDGAGKGKTVYLGIRLNDAVLAAPKTARELQSAQRGMGVAIGNIKDGTSNTIVFVEVAPEKAVVWTKPEDLDIDPKNPTQALSSSYGNRILAAFADGSCQFLPRKLPAETWLRLFQKSDGEAVQWDEIDP